MKSRIKCERNINLEWLRICSMFMIILLHSIDHSGLLENLMLGSSLYYYEQFLYALVQVCVNCFVLISGYFLVNSKFKPEKLVALWIEVVFYSLSIKIIMMMLGEIPFSIISLASCFLPIMTGRYWFVTIYFGMYLLSPFFNVAIRAMNKKQHRELLILLFVLNSVMVSIHPSLKGMNSGGGWGLTWFSVLYFTAAYIRQYHERNNKYKKLFFIFLFCPFLMFIILWFAQKLGIGILVTMAKNLWRYDSAFVYIASVALFVAFLNSDMSAGGGHARIVVRLSSTTFGIYLIHAHANICTETMWQHIGMLKNMSAWWFPLYQIVVVSGIFLICAMFDYIRQIIFNKLSVNLFIKKMCSNILSKRISGKE